MPTAVARAPDVIWLNGAFGVGKTTVAELLVERIDGATLLDPEVIGGMLQELLPAPWQEDDWQDIRLWRQLTDSRFAEQVEADARDAGAVAAEIYGRLAA